MSKEANKAKHTLTAGDLVGIVMNKLEERGVCLDDWGGQTADEIAEEIPPIDAAPDLLAALEDALPTLERAATEEARANKAPTGLPPKTDAMQRWEAARAAIAKAKGKA